LKVLILVSSKRARFNTLCRIRYVQHSSAAQLAGASFCYSFRTKFSAGLDFEDCEVNAAAELAAEGLIDGDFATKIGPVADIIEIVFVPTNSPTNSPTESYYPSSTPTEAPNEGTEPPTSETDLPTGGTTTEEPTSDSGPTSSTEPPTSETDLPTGGTTTEEPTFGTTIDLTSSTEQPTFGTTTEGPTGGTTTEGPTSGEADGREESVATFSETAVP